METRILKPSALNITLCAEEIKKGGVVAFPTETVYGLGACAFDENAVKKIYEVKGRPSDNPLIVHIADKSQLERLVTDVPKKAQKLLEKLMPGALTLVLNKQERVPLAVTGGLETVAVRMPSNEIALQLIKKCGFPVCAPSANKSGLPSPTQASHVLADLGGKIKYILDGGRCEIGLESSVIDLTTATPRLLRAGGITVEEIQSVIGKIEIYQNNCAALSPGMKYKHYSPKADVYFSAFYDNMHQTITLAYERLKDVGKNPVVFALEKNLPLYKGCNVYSMGKDYKSYAYSLFHSLRRADDEGYDVVIAEGVSSDGIGASIINRLLKSSGGQVI